MIQLMSRSAGLMLVCVLGLEARGGESFRWPLEAVDSPGIIVRGEAFAKPGVSGQRLAMDSGSLVELYEIVATVGETDEKSSVRTELLCS